MNEKDEIQAKVADFGLAQRVDSSLNQIQATWQWLPPEVFTLFPDNYPITLINFPIFLKLITNFSNNFPILTIYIFLFNPKYIFDHKYPNLPDN